MRRGDRRERGLQLVETALVAPILIVFIGAIGELSFYFYTYSTLARATRASARYISTKPFTSEEIVKAKNMVVCGEVNTCEGYASVINGLTAAKVDVTLTGAAGNQTATVKIINFNHTPFFNLNAMTKNSNWTNPPINAGTTMRYTGNL